MNQIKKIVKTKIIISVIFFTLSCDDFLTEDPKIDLFESVIYENELNAATAVTACYAQITAGNYYGTDWPKFPQASSIFITTGVAMNSTGRTQRELIRMGIFEYDGNIAGIGNMFRGAYAAVNTCNRTIFGIENSSGISDEAKNRLISDAKFLRALTYFNIVRTWGRSPFYLKPHTTIEEAHRPKSEVNVIFDAIIEDFEFAARYMLEKNDPRRDAGRPFNYAAKAMLAKVYAHLATSEYLFLDSTDPYTAEDRSGFWRKAYDYAKEVYDAKVYSLLPDYDKLWRCQSINTDELIYEIQFNPMTNRNNWGYSMIPPMSTYTPFAASNANNGQIRPGKVAYEWQIEKYSTHVQVGEQSILTDIDPRLAANFVTTGSYPLNAGGSQNCYPTPVPRTNVNRFPAPIKYTDPLWTSGQVSRMNWPYYRYADLLLLLAECANEIGDPDGIKFTVVNEVLQRARNSGKSLIDDSPSKEPADWEPSDSRYATVELFREEVMKERLFEMPMEGHEWYDVRRRGIDWFIKMATQYNYGVEEYALPDENNAPANELHLFKAKAPTDRNTVRKFLLMPFPFEELNNNRALTLDDQNYGYSRIEIDDEDDD